MTSVRDRALEWWEFFWEIIPFWASNGHILVTNGVIYGQIFWWLIITTGSSLNWCWSWNVMVKCGIRWLPRFSDLHRLFTKKKNHCNHIHSHSVQLWSVSICNWSWCPIVLDRIISHSYSLHTWIAGGELHSLKRESLQPIPWYLSHSRCEISIIPDDALYITSRALSMNLATGQYDHNRF